MNRISRPCHLVIRSIGTVPTTAPCKPNLNRLPSFRSTKKIFRHRSTKELLLTAGLFKLCSYHTLVDIVKSLLTSDIGWIRKTSERIVKATIFGLFCGGEKYKEAVHVMKKLYDTEGITTLIDCSSEESEEEAAFDANTDEKVKKLLFIGSQSIPGQSNENNNSNNHHNNIQPVKFMPIKCTSLIDASLLERMTTILSKTPSHSGNYDDIMLTLSESDQNALKMGMLRFESICNAAKQSQIGILLDAEQSHRQPGIEIIARQLFSKYNQLHRPPLVYNTYQMYLQRTRGILEYDLKLAREKKYTFGAKMVRGAYLYSEKNALQSLVWSSKRDTDTAYEDAVHMLIQEIASHHVDNHGTEVAVLVATHNRHSIEKIVAKMKDLKLINNHSHIHFAQILGMSDHVTVGLAQAGKQFFLIPFRI